MIKALSVLGITSLLGGGAVIYALNQPLNNDTSSNDTQGCQTHVYEMHNDDYQNWTGESLLNDENMLLLQLRGLDKKRSDLLRRSGLEGLTFRQILMQEDSEEAVALLSPILERLSIQAEKLKKVKGGTDRLIRIRMKQLEQRLAGAKQSDPHVYDKYV